MTSVLKWMASKVTNVSNSAAESILRSIIIRFLEEPIQDETISLQLFQDWTLKLILRKTFICVNLVNPYTPFLHFNSIYISKINFNAKYNLSKFLLEVERIVIDIDAKMPEKVETPDLSLQQSLIELKQQLPHEARKSNSFGDYLMNTVQEVKASIEYFTTIVRIRSDLPCSLGFENLSAEITGQPNGVIDLKSLNFIVGERRNQINIANIQNTSIKYHEKALTCSIDSINMHLDKETLDLISTFISYLPQRMQAHKNSPKNEQSQANSKFEITKTSLIIKQISFSMNGIQITLNNLNISMVDGMSVTFDSIEAKYGELTILQLNQTNLQLLMPTNLKKLATFADFPISLHEALNYNAERKKGRYTSIIANIGNVSVEITKGLLFSVNQIIEWINSFVNSLPKTFSNHPPVQNNSSMLVLSKIPRIDFKFQNTCLGIENIGVKFMLASAGMWKNTRVLATVDKFVFAVSDKYNVLEASKFLQVAFAMNESIGKDPFIFVGALIGDILARIPGDLSFMRDLNELMLPKSDKPAETTQESRQKLQIDVRTQSLICEYACINIPCRLFVAMPPLTFLMSSENDSFNIIAHAKLSIYFTNSRVSICRKNLVIPIKHIESSIAHILDTSFRINFEKIHGKTFIKVNEFKLNGGICADSLSLLLAFISHVQYGLDLPIEQQTQTRHFNPPDKLLELQNAVSVSVMQSMNLNQMPIPGNFDINEMKQKSCIFESIDKMCSKVVVEEGDEYSDLPDADITYGEVTSEPDVIIDVENALVEFSIFGGRDLDGVYDLCPLKEMPELIDTKTEDDFDLLCMRDESSSVQLNLQGNLTMKTYSKDPLYALTMNAAFPTFNIVDNIPNSDSAMVIGKDPTSPNEDKLVLNFNILKSEGPRMEVTFSLKPPPKMVTFITHDLIEFFVRSFNCTRPTFPCETIIDEPLAFQLFEIGAFDLLAYAHFTFYVNVHLDDVNMHVPACKVLACRGDHLASSLADFYIRELARPGAAAVASGLPVVRSIRNISSALSMIFDFKGNQYGRAGAVALGCMALFKVLAFEALNAGAGAANIAQGVLQATLDVVDGKNDADEAIHNGLASLILSGQGIQTLPTLILAPGVLTLRKLSEAFKLLRDRVASINRKRNALIKKK